MADCWSHPVIVTDWQPFAAVKARGEDGVEERGLKLEGGWREFDGRLGVAVARAMMNVNPTWMIMMYVCEEIREKERGREGEKLFSEM